MTDARLKEIGKKDKQPYVLELIAEVRRLQAECAAERKVAEICSMDPLEFQALKEENKKLRELLSRAVSKLNYATNNTSAFYIYGVDLLTREVNGYLEKAETP